MEVATEWVWDERKARANRKKHGVGFDVAKLVFDDPRAVSRPDRHEDSDRWQTIGEVGPIILFVVHTEPVLDPTTNLETGRVISARRADRREREAYEQGEFW